ncbi:type IX secretion system membrane protein PorP/SprF [Sinomicrobium kalidii]|uniref:PorP/SprF family type IX secretion system membrane protein n=1 Tax=Sinomicrobium kalidii TaxID=2900738 RepID=UPI001E50923E|nr:type IX secretion system membrane protein PorP/SprF [Sinomicrobium kalidii]UGU16843.1 type IX secretion system membrane protein PorP/SprF [Sinomicrobium kalidii]
MKKNTLLLLLLLLGVAAVHGQQEPQYTQYMYNTVSVNPGYAGTRGVTSLFGLYRSQWVGLDGAPKTAQFSVHSPVSYRGHGLGLSIINDRIGPAQDTYVSASFSYLLQLSPRTKLNLGLMAGGSFLEVDYDKLNVEHPGDPELSGRLSKFSPNIGAGAYLHADNWYVGLSVPALLETHFYDDIQQSVAREKMHFYLIGGYVFDLNPNLKFKPAGMVKAVSGAPLAVDVTANFLFHENFTLGAAYHWDAAVSALAGFQITEGLQVGYAYDWDTTRLGNYNSGTYEIFLRFEFISSAGKRLRTPRFF